MEGRDGDGTAPKNEVLGILADLAEGKNIALSNLIEASGPWSDAQFCNGSEE